MKDEAAGRAPMREVLRDPRLTPPVSPMSYATAVKEMQAQLTALGNAVAAAHHRIFPRDVDVRYVVTQRNGRVKVRFEPTEVKEAGYKDA